MTSPPSAIHPALGRRSLMILIVVGCAVTLALAAGLATAAPEGTAAAVLQDDTAVENASEPAVSEDAYVVRAPEEGDEYFEMGDPDGEWVSYVNPRDEYRTPIEGEGSGKVCLTLVNEAGEPVVGKSVPDTTVTIPTGEALAWHPDADPMVVELPMTDHYDRPLDADQFGTTEDLPQGDGYLDSYCVEFHGLAEDETVTYGEPTIEGAYAANITLVGYHQQDGAAWETDRDPVADATDYGSAGGGWTFEPDASHGQVVIVLQLDGPTDRSKPGGEPQGDDGGAVENGDEAHTSNGPYDDGDALAPDNSEETSASEPDSEGSAAHQSSAEETANDSPGSFTLDSGSPLVWSAALVGALGLAVGLVVRRLW